MLSKRLHYEAALKRKVIVYAEEHGNGAASRHFDISEVNVRHWRNDHNSIFSCKATTKCFTGPKKGRFPQVDEAVIRFVIQTRAKGLPITQQVMQLKAIEIAKSLRIEEIIFKGSRGWCDRLMHHSGLSLRRRTTICQKIPADFQQKLINFQQYVIKLRKKRKYEFSQIGNADETLVYFDIPRNYTVNAKGAKEVKIMSYEVKIMKSRLKKSRLCYEKHRITVMLCITADGGKLPPYLILNRKTIPKNEIFPKDVIVRAQKNGWKTAELMEYWLSAVWNRRLGNLCNPPSMLVLDAFRGHLSDQVKNKIVQKCCDLVVIPGGMTSQLQPLDVSVNKPFKDYLRKEYVSWLLTDNLPLTPSGKIKKAPASKLAEWVSRAWKLISEKIVQQSFKKCCITNALDGSEEWDNEDKDGSEKSDSDIDSEGRDE